MNSITIKKAKIIRMKTFPSRGGLGLDVDLCDTVGTNTVYYRATFFDEAARRMQRTLSEGDMINISGSVRVQIYKTRAGKDGFCLILENPMLLDDDQSGPDLFDPSDMETLLSHEGELLPDEFYYLYDLPVDLHDLSDDIVNLEVKP